MPVKLTVNNQSPRADYRSEHGLLGGYRDHLSSTARVVWRYGALLSRATALMRTVVMRHSGLGAWRERGGGHTEDRGA